MPPDSAHASIDDERSHQQSAALAGDASIESNISSVAAGKSFRMKGESD